MKALLFVFLLSVPAVVVAQVEPIEEIIEPAGNFDPKEFGKVAVLQWANPRPTPIGVTPEEAEAFKQGAREAIESYIRQAAAKGAKMIITPEFSLVGYPDIPELPPEEDEFRNRSEIEPYVEKVPGPSTKYFSKLAKELGVYIHIGLAEVEEGTSKYFNTVVAIGPNGEILEKYRKMNLFKLEHQFLSPGEGPRFYSSIFGRVGMVVCADIYNSSPMGKYKTLGIDVLALSTSWAQMNTGWSYFTRGATWVGAPILAANQIYFPDSGVINADGTTQSHIRQTDGLAYGYLKLKSEGPRSCGRALSP